MSDKASNAVVGRAKGGGEGAASKKVNTHQAP